MREETPCAHGKTAEELQTLNPPYPLIAFISPKQPLAQAINMQPRSKPQRLSFAVVHWILALSILVLIGLGWYLQYLPQTAPSHDFLIRLHISLGLTGAILFALEILFWLIFGSFALPGALPRPQGAVTANVYLLIYVCLAIVGISGLLQAIASTTPLQFWELSISVRQAENPELALFYGALHLVSALALTVLAVTLVGVAIIKAWQQRKRASTRLSNKSLGEFQLSFWVTAICLALAAWWGHSSGMGIGVALWLTVVLGILETSLSFDNAVVNAGVLKHMSDFWQTMFLTVGILIAVFGMRLLFPIVIVAVATGLGPLSVLEMALQNPEQYSQVLHEQYASVAAFGGMFLLLVFLEFIFDDERDLHWLGGLERFLAKLGKADAMSVIVAIGVLMLTSLFLPESVFQPVLFAGVGGILLYLAVNSIDAFLEAGEAGKRTGAAGFIYLEVLDASFSFDGVIGAFAITRDIVIIMLGLGIGAMFVRSMTVYLVNKGTLNEFVFLEHGAHYAIGVLAIIMLVGTTYHVPEVITGLIGVTFIGASVLSSIRHRKRNAAAAEASPEYKAREGECEA